jgi:hypothetical protein
MNTPDQICQSLQNFRQWTADDDLVGEFEKFVEQRSIFTEVKIKTQIGEIILESDDSGSITRWWIGQISRTNSDCKERLQQVALGGIRGDDFDSFLQEVSNL